jgi:hypothetical protein
MQVAVIRKSAQLLTLLFISNSHVLGEHRCAK